MAGRARRKFNGTDVDSLIYRAIDENGAVIIKRPGRGDVALIAAEKLRQLDTTDYLLASPNNRRRLATALRDIRSGKGKPISLRLLRALVGR